MTLLSVLVGLCTGNFLFQVFGEGLWSVAVERSILQAVALLTYALVTWLMT